MKIRASERSWYAELGGRIRAGRAVRGKTQRRLAAETGIHEGRICHIERGAAPTLRELVLIRCGLGIKIELPPPPEIA